jgi:hypothetical protein
MDVSAPEGVGMLNMKAAQEDGKKFAITAFQQ